MKPRTIFSVSLIENIETLSHSIPILLKNYPDATYYLICKKRDLKNFHSRLPDNQRLVIIGEDEVISFEEFSAAHRNILLSRKLKYSSERLSWYYQQAIKLTFTLKSAESFQSRFPLVMFDADSIPLNMINFFEDGNNSILYGSLSERHLDYFRSLEFLFGKFKYPVMGFTTQFFSSTLNESLYLIKSLQSRYFDRRFNIEELVAYSVLESTLEAHGSIEKSRFSEQELFGVSNMFYSRKRRQIPIFSFRSWILNETLSNRQMKILAAIGVSLVTYENRARVEPKMLGWNNFIKLVFSDFRPQLLKFIQLHLSFRLRKILTLARIGS